MQPHHFSLRHPLIRISTTLLLCFFCPTCAEPAKDSASPDSVWLKGTSDEKFHTVARQLRGFDMAMMETAHRYTELYWAGRDGNWQYAKYQAEKIRTAIENGLQRRPKRAASAQTFLTFVLPEMLTAIEKQDSSLFWNRFGALTSTCNACHEAEKVAFINVAPPETRLSPAHLFK
ncbi:MAG: hypothetical protein HY961_08175 [Ignavibacteriae bacterium]|nr:hypothetical protein [Ignavibacteriota bacterium]